MDKKTKECSRCKIEKFLNEFHKNRASSDGYAFQCKSCAKQIYQENRINILSKHQEYYKKNSGSIKRRTGEYRKRMKKENPNWKKIKEMAYIIKANFDDVERWFNQKWLLQQAKCAICGKVFSDDDCIDHDHNKTGVESLRGLLCSNCNSGIGFLQDSPDICLKAAGFLISSHPSN